MIPETILSVTNFLKCFFITGYTSSVQTQFTGKSLRPQKINKLNYDDGKEYKSLVFFTLADDFIVNEKYVLIFL